MSDFYLRKNYWLWAENESKEEWRSTERIQESATGAFKAADTDIQILLPLTNPVPVP